MQISEALQKSHEVIRAANLNPEDYNPHNFLEYGPFVIDIIRHHWTQTQRENCPWLADWIVAWKELYDDFEVIAAADPGMLYRPQHKVSEAFHRSLAFIRYFRSGNRCSKTQSAYLEHYWFLTRQHPHRDLPRGVNNTFIVGYDFNKYVPAVFAPKMLTGEADNPLSPLFPEDGKWFYHYDKQTHTLTVSCPDCARVGKAQSCAGHHPKSTCRIYSDERGWENLQGFSGRLGHFDEHIGEIRTFQEAKQRLMTAQGSSFMVTGTPLHGEESWETRNLALVAEGPSRENLSDPKDPKSPPYVEMFQIDQYAAGLVSRARIDAERKAMDEFEVEARIFGKPAPLAEVAVFDRKKLRAQKLSEPLRAALHIKGTSESIETLQFASDLNLVEASDGPIRIWEKPENDGWYIMAVDTAAGLDPGSGKQRAPDYSCATVLRYLPHVTRHGLPRLEMVAQWHGWLSIAEYADEVKKLGIYYNTALAVIELTGGYGTAVMQRLRYNTSYMNIFRAARKAEEVTVQPEFRYGVDTNQNTKPTMVANLQGMVLHEQIVIPCSATIKEMVAFTQERTEKGIINRFRGAGGAKDDRVMALAIGAYAAVSYPLEDYFRGFKAPERPKDKVENETWAQVHREMDRRENPDPFGVF